MSIWTQMLEKTGTIDNQYIHMKRQAQIEDCWEKWGMGTGKHTRGFDADRTSSFRAAASRRIASSWHQKAPRPRGSSLTFRFLKQTGTLNVQERTPPPPRSSSGLCFFCFTTWSAAAALTRRDIIAFQLIPMPFHAQP